MQVRVRRKVWLVQDYQDQPGTTEEQHSNNRGSDRPRFSLFQASTLKLGVLISRIQTSKRKPKENRRKENNMSKQEVKHQA